MAFQKVEFEFPDEEQKDNTLEIEGSGEIEIDISGQKTAEDYKESEPEVETEPEVEAEVEPEPEVEIEVYDDTPKADRNRKPSEPPADVTEEELADYSDKVQKRIKHFSKGYHDERRAKEAAQRERDELERYVRSVLDENKDLKNTVEKNREVLLEQAKKSTTAELEQAKQQYKDAYEAGDTDRVLEAQESLTSAKIRSDKLDNFELSPLQEEETPVQPQPEPLDQRASEWKRDNPWFEEDVEMRTVALGVHHKLINQGVSPQSDQYYETINARMRKIYPEYFGVEEVEKPKPRSNVVAPAARSTSPKKVKLSQSAQTIARRLGVPYDEYAKQQRLLERGNN